MAFTQENVLGATLSGFTAELVDLSTGISSGVLDDENNLYILDEKRLYFGNDKDYHFKLNNESNGILFGDSSNNSLFQIYGDGSVGLKATETLEILNGNLAYKADGLYVLK